MCVLFSVGELASLRELDVTLRTGRSHLSEIAHLCSMLSEAKLLRSVTILIDFGDPKKGKVDLFREMPNAFSKILEGIPCALQDHNALNKLEISLDGSRPGIDVSNFVNRCARIRRLSSFSLYGSFIRLCATAMDNLLGSGVQEIVLEDVAFYDPDIPCSRQEWKDYSSVQSIKLDDTCLTPATVGIFQNTMPSLREFRIYHEKDDQRTNPGCIIDNVAALLKGKESLGPLELRLGGDNGMHFDDEALSMLAESLDSRHALKVLELRAFWRGCTITDTGCSALSRALGTSSTLESLSIVGVFLTNVSLACKTEFFEALGRNKNLKILDISKNDFTREDFLALTHTLSSGGTDLQKITYESGGAGSGHGHALVLGGALSENKSLSELLIDQDSEESDHALEDCKVFGAALRHNSVLERLAIGGVYLGDEECAAIVSGLSSNHTLRELDLSDILFGNVACDVLCTVLRTNYTLESISLRCSIDSDEDAIKFVHALCENSGVKVSK